MKNRPTIRRLATKGRAALSALKSLSEKLWVRISAIAALALVAAGLSTAVGPFLPDELKGLVAPEAVEDLLNVIAQSMLAVTIFSLSVMVTVHRAVEGQWTPRAHRLLARDHVTLTAISVFLGGWLYALAGQILLDATLVGGVEHVFLFFMTVLVVLLIVIVVMRWVSHLASLGSLTQTGARLEEETRAAFARRAAQPCLGGHCLSADTPIPANARPVLAERTGWITAVDAAALEAVGAEAEGNGVPVFLLVPIGAFVGKGDVIARVPGPDERLEEVRDAITVGELRAFTDDPGYALLSMSEVAQRALSPGVNDPGTAIEMLGRMLRALEAWAPEHEPGEPERPHLWSPPLAAGPLLQSAFLPIARDGAGQVEVALAAIAVLDRLAGHPDESMAEAARSASAAARARAERTLEDPVDLKRLARGPEAPETMPADAGPSRPMVKAV